MEVPTEVYTWFLNQGPLGVAILLLMGVVVYLFKRWDRDREQLIQYGIKYAELTVSSAKVIEIANQNATSFIEAMQTVKILSDLIREKRP